MRKKIVNVFLIITLFAGGYMGYQYIVNRSYITQERFEEAHQKLNSKVDSLRQKVSVLENNQDTIITNQKHIKDGQKDLRSNQDSLKAGQTTILKKMFNRDRNESYSLKDFLSW